MVILAGHTLCLDGDIREAANKPTAFIELVDADQQAGSSLTLSSFSEHIRPTRWRECQTSVSSQRIDRQRE